MTERTQTISLALAGSLALVVGLTRLIPVDYRLYNMAAVGALALFAGARIGLWQSLAITFAAMLTSDAILLYQNDFNQQYVPFASIYAAMALYAVCGYLFLRTTENPLRIGIVAILASFQFFVWTNFVSWFSPLHGYDRSLSGLLTCYEAALPFYRGTLFGDLAYTGLLFGTYSIAIRVLVPAREAATVKS